MAVKGLATALLVVGLIAATALDAAMPAGAAAALSWAPPNLVNPITITLCNCNLNNGQIIVNLAIGQDYVLEDPVVLTYPVVIQGGHNVVWIGGEIRPTSAPAIGIHLIRNVGYGGGTIHLEGIYLNGVDGVLTDGIAGGEWGSLYQPSGTLADAILQIENVRVGPMSGDSGLDHQDCIQQYGGWQDLRVGRERSGQEAGRFIREFVGGAHRPGVRQESQQPSGHAGGEAMKLFGGCDRVARPRGRHRDLHHIARLWAQARTDPSQPSHRARLPCP